MKSIRILLALCCAAIVLSGSEPLTNQIIVRMVQAGVPAETIIQTIRAADSFQFGMLPGDLAGLTQAKVPDDVIKAMAAKIKGALAPAPQATAAIPAATPAPAAARSTVGPEGLMRGEIYGGFAYGNFATFGRTNVYGWEAAGGVNVTRWFAVEGDGSGQYVTGLHEYFVGGGPRFNFRPVFFHALAGLNRFGIGADGFGFGLNAFAMAIGGGVDVPVGHGVGIRAGIDYLPTHQGTIFQHNGRATGGITYSFGKVRR